MAKRSSKRSKRTPADLVPASAIAESVGKSKRAVQLWAKRKNEPCPSHAGRGGNNRPTRLFVKSEVFEWMDRQGIDRPGAPVEAPPPPREIDAPDQKPTGNKGFDWYINWIYEQIQYLASQPAPQSAAEARVYSQAIKNLSTEYRSLVKDIDRIHEITRGWVRSEDALRAVVTISRVLGSEIDSLEAELPGGVVDVLIKSELLDPAHRDDAMRFVSKLLAGRMGSIRSTGRQIIEDQEGTL